MSRPRSFRPVVGELLEGRLLLAAGAVQAYAPSAPYYDQITTTYAGGNAGNIVGVGRLHGSTEVEYRMAVPLAANSISTTEYITLPGNAGRETILKVAATQGSVTSNRFTITLPDGVTAQRTNVEIAHGNVTTISGTLTTPGVGVQTTRGMIIHAGRKTTTNETIQTAGGQIYHYHKVTTQITPFKYITVSTTRSASGKTTEHVKSTTITTPFLLASV